MKTRIAMVVFSGVFVAAVQLSVGAQGSVSAGIYSDEQAKRGATVYADNCASCHGADLSGGDPIPGLLGAKFLANWKNVGDLFDKIQMTMPAYAPGSLMPAQTADVLAHMLSVNKYPAGTAELAPGPELKSITIEPPK